MKNNTYRLYQMKDTQETKPYIHQSFGSLMALGYHPALKDYDLTVSGLLSIDDNVRTLCEKIEAKRQNNQTHRPMGIGDILVVCNGSIVCYFNEAAGFAVLDDFYEDDKEYTALHLTIQSKNVSLPGRSGHWNAINSTAVEQTAFFLLQSVEFGDNAAWIIADDAGNIIIDDNRTDFDGETVQRLRQYLRPELSSFSPNRHYAPAILKLADAANDKEKPVIQKRISLRLRLREKQLEIQIERQEKQMTIQ